MHRARKLAMSVGLAWTCWTFGANAQDVAAAIALFDRAVAALERGDFGAACPDFAESQRLAPQLGTLFQLAKCEEGAGKIASADAHYHQFLTEVRALSDAKRPKYQARVQEAETARASFVGEIPTLTLILPADTPANVEVIRDGTTLTAVTLGVAIPADPGEHLVTTQVPGGPRHEQRFVIERKDTKTVQLEIELPPPPPKPPETLVQVKPVKPVAPFESGSTSLRTGGFVVLGVGLAGLAVFGVSGGVAISKKSFYEENCPNNRCRDQAGIDAWNDGKTLANVTSFGMGLSLAVAAVGVTMLGVHASRTEKRVTKPSVRALFVDVDRTGVGFGVKGCFE